MSNVSNAYEYAHSLIQNVLIGGGIFFICLSIAIAYIPCLLAMWRYDDLWRYSCIKLMFNTGVVDLINVGGQSIYALVIMLRLQPYFGAGTFTGLCQVSSGLRNSAKVPALIDVTVDLTWYVVVPMMNILGINRILVLLHERIANVVFSGTRIIVREKLSLDRNKANDAILSRSLLSSCGCMALHGGCTL